MILCIIRSSMKKFYQVSIQNITNYIYIIFVFVIECSYFFETIPVYIMLHNEGEILLAYIVHHAFILFCAVYLSGHGKFRSGAGDYTLNS